MIKSIVVSLLVTVVLSLVGATICNFVFEYNFIKSFVVFILVQLSVSFIWSSILSYLANVNAAREETARLELYSQQGVDADCAYCKKTNFIPIRMDEVNDFICDSCGKNNSVYIDVTIAQKTDIIDKDSLSVKEYIKDKIDATERIKSK
jgi:hypothetical protein